MFQPLWASFVTVGVGAATWIFAAIAGGRREAWDSELYFVFVLPIVALTAAVVSYKVPTRTWRWAMFPFAAQAIIMFVQAPNGNLLPLGLIMFLMFGAMCVIPARIGALVGRKLSS